MNNLEYPFLRPDEESRAIKYPGWALEEAEIHPFRTVELAYTFFDPKQPEQGVNMIQQLIQQRLYNETEMTPTSEGDDEARAYALVMRILSEVESAGHELRSKGRSPDDIVAFATRIVTEAITCGNSMLNIDITPEQLEQLIKERVAERMSDVFGMSVAEIKAGKYKKSAWKRLQSAITSYWD